MIHPVMAMHRSDLRTGRPGSPHALVYSRMCASVYIWSLRITDRWRRRRYFPFYAHQHENGSISWGSFIINVLGTFSILEGLRPTTLLPPSTVPPPSKRKYPTRKASILHWFFRMSHLNFGFRIPSPPSPTQASGTFGTLVLKDPLRKTKNWNFDHPRLYKKMELTACLFP